MLKDTQMPNSLLSHTAAPASPIPASPTTKPRSTEMSINTPAAPGPLPDDPPHRPADPSAARDHVRRLHQDGRTYQAIAATAGLAPATVSGLATGRRRPTHGTTTAILAVTSATVPRGRVDAGGTRC